MTQPAPHSPLRRVADEDQEQLACLADRYACWLHPWLVGQVALANQAAFSYQAEEEVPAFVREQYAWPGSTCFYPGIRRRIGRSPKGSYLEGNALKTDETGNIRADYVWRKLAPATIRPVSKKQAEEAKANGEPAVYRNGYHLVHLFPHKPDEVTRLLQRDDVVTSAASASLWEAATANGFPGLFTSAANMCLLPGELTRPTDARSRMRDVLWYRAVQLYGVGFLPLLLRPLGEKLLLHPPLPDLPAVETLNYIGRQETAVWWQGVDVARRKRFDTALRGWWKFAPQRASALAASADAL